MIKKTNNTKKEKKSHFSWNTGDIVNLQSALHFVVFKCAALAGVCVCVCVCVRAQANPRCGTEGT